MTDEHTIEFRVSYYETDGQGRVHHAQYINYCERGRVELLRSLGRSYSEIEASGLMLVVSEFQIRYLQAAQFDDTLALTTSVISAKGVRILHSYDLRLVEPAAAPPAGRSAEQPERNIGSPIIEATSTVACVDRHGKICRLPDFLRRAPRKLN